MKIYKRQWVVWLTTFLGVILLDRLTKWWVVTVLQEREIVLFPGVNFILAWNRGVSWGLFSSTSNLGFYLLSFFIAIVIIFFIMYTISEYRRGTLILFELLVIAGALSNFIDRLYYGAVVDFIDLYVYSWHWPTFNVADACIVIGIGGIVAKGFICVRKKK